MKRLLLGLLAGMAASTAQATLIDRSNGLLYDDVLNVTWTQDANLAGRFVFMDWAAANAWAENLTYGGYSDWRLPSIKPIGNSNGVGDIGYNISNPQSELAYMYHVNLGLTSRYDTAGNERTDFGIFGNGTISGQNDIGLVKNLQPSVYWFGTEYASSTSNAWVFSTMYGLQGVAPKDGRFSVWAVRDGDVSTVPVPAAVWLFASGLAGLMLQRGRSDNACGRVARCY
jgi:hypothetical protein